MNFQLQAHKRAASVRRMYSGVFCSACRTRLKLLGAVGGHKHAFLEVFLAGPDKLGPKIGLGRDPDEISKFGSRRQTIRSFWARFSFRRPMFLGPKLTPWGQASSPIFGGPALDDVEPPVCLRGRQLSVRGVTPAAHAHLARRRVASSRGSPRRQGGCPGSRVHQELAY